MNLLREFPERFTAKEAHELDMRKRLGADVAILRDRTGGVSKPLPLTILRQRFEAEDAGAAEALFDRDDLGSCGCLTDFGSVAA